jgi:hypothetical protein
VRKVSVALEADVAPFIAPVGRAGAATEELDRKVEALDRDLNKLAPDSLKAAAALKTVGDEGAAVGTKTGKARDELGRFTAGVRDTGSNAKVAGEGLRQFTADLAELDRQITLHKGSIASLKGDSMLFSSSKDQITQHRAEIADLLDARKKLVASFGDSGGDAGKGFIRRFTDMLGGGSNSMVQGLSNIPWVGIIFKPFAAAMQHMPPEVQIAIAGSIATAILAGSAFIGAALNAVLLSAVGLGGIAAGIVGQISNPVVHDAWANLFNGVVMQFQAATASFAAPLAYSARIFGAAWDEILPHVQAGFESLSKFIYPLAAGIANLFRNLTPGLDKAFAAAGPILQELANQLPSLGSSLSKFFALLADGGKGAQEGLRALFMIMNTLVIGIGGLIDGLSHLWQGFVTVGEAVSGFTVKMLGWYPVLGSWLKTVHGWWDELKNGGKNVSAAAAGMDQFAQSTKASQDELNALNTTLNTTRVTADSLAGAMSGKIFDSMMNIDQATLKWHESLFNINDALKKNGHALDINTVKGEDNQKTILAAVQANMQIYQAQIAAGISAGDAAAAYDVNTMALERQLRKAGFTQAAIDGLIGKYRSVPDQVNTDIAMHGLTDAINGLADLIATINHIPRYVGVTVTETYIANRQSTYSQQVPKFRAAGGPVAAGHAYVVGEKRPEVFVPSMAGTILPDMAQFASRGSSSPASGWTGGSMAVAVTVSAAPGGSNLDQAMSSWFMGAVRKGQIQITAKSN